MRNSVTKADATIIGSPNRPNAWEIEFNPEFHVTTAVVTWNSGLNSISHAFGRFGDPMMVASAFVTLFLIGCVLADARVLTHSLWLSIGLHAGWIFEIGR